MRPFRIALVTAVAALALLAATAAWIPRPSRRASSRPGPTDAARPRRRRRGGGEPCGRLGRRDRGGQDLIEYALMAGFVP